MPKARMPALFVGHGSPMNAIEDNDWTRGWEDIAREIPRPKAILCVSAHWETQDLAVTADARPKTIHDFGGFPKALFDMQYAAPGSPELAARVPDITSIDTRQALDWGLDHGAWSVLRHMYPEADVPVFQLSLDHGRTFAEHLELGRELRNLRDRGILILGSGNLVHNLQQMNWEMPNSAFPWASEFDSKVKQANDTRDVTALAAPGRWAASAAPTRCRSGRRASCRRRNVR
jgi:4,5-DOPA dioxygenase extradiol